MNKILYYTVWVYLTVIYIEPTIDKKVVNFVTFRFFCVKINTKILGNKMKQQKLKLTVVEGYTKHRL